MAKLIELPNGDWIDPQTVESVRYLPAERLMGSEIGFPDRLIVTCGKNGHIVLNCIGPEEVMALKSDLIKQINDAR